MKGSKFIIDGLPRTGSTTLANLLGCHSEIRCLVEPFHPRRYGGQFHQLAMNAGSVEPALNLIWRRYQGLKHVWLPGTSSPFPLRPEMNDELVLRAPRVIFIQRRNFLQRYVSAIISRKLDFWIGPRAAFLARLENAALPEFEPALVLREIHRDKEALMKRHDLLRTNHKSVMQVFYEDLYATGSSTEQRRISMNAILEFLEYDPVSGDDFVRNGWMQYFDEATYKWASHETYERIPGINRLEHEAGSDETGWLFQ